MTKPSIIAVLLFAAAPAVTGCATTTPPASAPSASDRLTYADLVTLADAADLVIRAEVQRTARLDPERAPDVALGYARLYVEATTQALVAGTVPVGETLKYLVDVPVTGNDKVPNLKKQTVLLFARAGQGRPGELQLVDPRAQLAWSEPLAERVRTILGDLVRPDAPPVVTGIADALSIDGNLVGESETQVFLDTATGRPASINVLRRPGQPPRWGVSWSELVDQSAAPVVPETLGWYRLACGLPATLPSDASLSRDPDALAQATRDYAFVLEQLGPCRQDRMAG